MELPSYHLPKLSTVLRYAFDKALSFIKRAGTIIFVTNIIIWFSSSYNWSLQMVETDESILASIGRSFLSSLPHLVLEIGEQLLQPLQVS